ncbi:MAG: fimbrillin family protein [Rikenellaceae bacterium]
MKKILYILSAVGLIVSSCSKDIDTDLSNVGDVAASFTNATITRATDGVWDSNEQIGIFAYDEAGAIYNSYENIPYITVSGGPQASFTPLNTIIYYPTGSSTLSFIAYSPYQDLADGLYDVTLTPQSTTEEVALIDLIVANDGVQYSSATPKANLQLDHKLAKITMTLKDGDGLDASDLAGVEVKLTNIATEGTYDLKGGTFTPSTADQTITPRTVTANSKFEAIIFPYAVAVFDVEFYLPVTDKTYTWDLNGEAFTSGKDHDYTITIKENSISISSATLSDWGVNESEDLTADKTTLIYNAEDLESFATAVNSGETLLNGKLMGNIELSGTWTPMVANGGSSNGYSGTFDGAGYSITGLSVSGTESGQGLFGTTVNATIKNLKVGGDVSNSASHTAIIVGKAWYTTFTDCETLEGSTVVANTSGDSTAGIAGYAYQCTFTSCINRADISGKQYSGGVVGYSNDNSTYTPITNCENYGDIDAGNYAGGIAGSTNSAAILVITNCYNAGSVTTTGTDFAGGIVAKMFGTSSTRYSKMINCANVGDVVCGTEYSGGLAGANQGGAIYNSYNLGDISASYKTVGGLVGIHEANSSFGAVIENCYTSGEVSGTSTNIGLAFGQVTASTITSCYYDSSKSNTLSAIGADYNNQTVTAYSSLSTLLTDLNSVASSNNSYSAWKVGDDSYPTFE